MWREDDLVAADQAGMDLGLLLVDVKTGAVDLAGLEGLHKSLLVDDGTDLTVIARDKLQHDEKFKRDLFSKSPRSSKICGKAIDGGHTLTVGNLKAEFPDGIQTKPYNSILAIPIFWNDVDKPFATVSIDSTAFYMFESFSPGKVANSLENSLMPVNH